MAAVDGKIYIMGGTRRLDKSRLCIVEQAPSGEVFDPLAGQFKPMSPIPDEYGGVDERGCGLTFMGVDHED